MAGVGGQGSGLEAGSVGEGERLTLARGGGDEIDKGEVECLGWG